MKIYLYNRRYKTDFYQTASLLTFVMYFLAITPEVCNKLREEISVTFGPDGVPTYMELKSMKYCRCHCEFIHYSYTHNYGRSEGCAE